MATGQPASRMQGKLSLGPPNNFNNAPLSILNSQKRLRTLYSGNSDFSVIWFKLGIGTEDTLSTLRQSEKKLLKLYDIIDPMSLKISQTGSLNYIKLNLLFGYVWNIPEVFKGKNTFVNIKIFQLYVSVLFPPRIMNVHRFFRAVQHYKTGKLWFKSKLETEVRKKS